MSDPAQPSLTPKLAAYIITLDEEAHIKAAVSSLRQVTANVLVLDSGSADTTRALAEAAGAVVRIREFDSYPEQRDAAVREAARLFKVEWVFALDADERVTAELAGEIRTKLPESKADIYLITLQPI